MRSRAMVSVWICLGCLATGSIAQAQEKQDDEVKKLREAVDRLRDRLDEIEREKAAPTPAPAPARAPAPAPAPAPGSEQTDADRALDEALAESEMRKDPTAAAKPVQSDIASGRVGPANLRLIDVSLDILAAAGSSTERNEEVEILQAGGHDPRRRGFTLQQAELSLTGAVDPYFKAEGHVIYFITPEGESEVELEEAFFQTLSLPAGFLIEGGHFFTEFGRINPQHPHSWDWLDQPVISSRLFGADGMRNPGFRVGWLSPLPWFSELHFGMQNAEGETMASFNGEGLAHGHGEEETEEEAFTDGIAGRQIVDRDVRTWEDFVYLARFVNGFDVTDTVSMSLGASALFGPNNTGTDGWTHIYGGDLVVKWRPESTQQRWPFVIWQTELMWRDFHADSFEFTDEGDPDDPADDEDVRLASDVIQDYGLYSQLLWGFIQRWAVGFRYEFARGSSGASLDGGAEIDREEDPFRDDRHRLAPLLVFHATEFSRLRLQYNCDCADHLGGGDDAHSVWFGVEVLYGAHPAHGY